MDFSTILGIVSGISLLLTAILMESPLSLFVSISAVMIVFGGTLAAILIGHPFKDVLKVMRVASNVFIIKLKEPAQLIVELINLATYVKRDPRGKLKLPELTGRIGIPFFATGAQLVADNIAIESIKRTLKTEMMITRQRHKLGREIFSQMGAYAPAFGMVGTLIGLVQMFSEMQDPSKIGGGMAIALLTTFYGAALSNLVFLPIASKLKRRSDEELFVMQICYEAILSIEAEESITLLEDKLSSFISGDIHEILDRRKRTEKEAV